MEARILEGPMETTQLLGGSVVFTCLATGIPIPTISWSSDIDPMIEPNNTVIFDDNSIMSEIVVDNIQMEDFVNYICSAMNQFNTVNASAALINASMLISYCRKSLLVITLFVFQQYQ